MTKNRGKVSVISSRKSTGKEKLAKRKSKYAPTV